MKKAISIFSFLSLCFLFFAGCSSHGKSVKARISSQHHKQLSNYVYDLNKPVIDRIAVIPDFLLKYYKEMDNIQEYRAYKISKQERDLFEEYYNFLPDKYKQIIDRKLIVIYFIEHFAGGGMADYVLYKDDQMYFILVLNPTILKDSLCDWIKYRDNSAFNSDGNIIAVNDLGDKYKGLLHTLVHESSHIYDYLYSITPYTEPDLQFFGYNKKKTVFTDKYWKDYFIPEPQYDFKDRTNIKPYGLGKALASEKQLTVYSDLKKTPFASLYGSLSWAEDFAETFTWFYLAEKFNIQYKVHLIKNGKVKLIYEPLKNKIAEQRYSQLKNEIEKN